MTQPQPQTRTEPQPQPESQPRDSLQRLQESHDCFAVLRVAVHDMQQIATDLDRVGLALVAAKVENAAVKVDHAVEKLRRISAEEVNDCIRKAQQASDNIILGVLAGIAKAGKRQDEPTEPTEQNNA